MVDQWPLTPKQIFSRLLWRNKQWTNICVIFFIFDFLFTFFTSTTSYYIELLYVDLFSLPHSRFWDVTQRSTKELEGALCDKTAVRETKIYLEGLINRPGCSNVDLVDKSLSSRWILGKPIALSSGQRFTQWIVLSTGRTTGPRSV